MTDFVVEDGDHRYHGTWDELPRDGTLEDAVLEFEAMKLEDARLAHNARRVTATRPEPDERIPPRDAFVACALCSKYVPGRVLPLEWSWLPDGRVCCDFCASSETAKTMWFEHKRRRRRR